ncbi:putative yuxK [Gossypium arboreum]|uniref:Putative yuxK n=2 Tax=Gossypium arboreum TaxID=29729 RepID=A0A0B0MPR5_GOSAR|nr:putative yuxK [Gossypium arboreum]
MRFGWAGANDAQPTFTWFPLYPTANTGLLSHADLEAKKATMYACPTEIRAISITKNVIKSTPNRLHKREIMAMLMKRIANLTKTTAKPSPPFSLKYLLLFSLSSASEKILAGTATDVAVISGKSDLVYSDPPVSATIKPLLPDLLQPRVVIYDGVCHLCHEGVKWVIKADKHRKIKFCCVQSKAAEPYLRVCGVDREDVLRRFVFIEGLGLYHQGSTAALRVLSYLPLPYSALSAFLIIPTPLRDAVYDFIAKRRYDWFGKSEDCLVLQESELLERFIDREEMMDRNRNRSNL